MSCLSCPQKYRSLRVGVCKTAFGVGFVSETVLAFVSSKYTSLSGIIESRLEMVKEAYEAVGMQVVFEKRKGEWFALVLKHKD